MGHPGCDRIGGDPPGVRQGRSRRLLFSPADKTRTADDRRDSLVQCRRRLRTTAHRAEDGPQVGHQPLVQLQRFQRQPVCPLFPQLEQGVPVADQVGSGSSAHNQHQSRRATPLEQVVEQAWQPRPVEQAPPQFADHSPTVAVPFVTRQICTPWLMACGAHTVVPACSLPIIPPVAHPIQSPARILHQSLECEGEWFSRSPHARWP